MVMSSYQCLSELCKVMYPHRPQLMISMAGHSLVIQTRVQMHCAMVQLYCKHARPAAHSKPGNPLRRPVVSTMPEHNAVAKWPQEGAGGSFNQHE